MFEREQLRDEFADILNRQRQVAERLEKLLDATPDAELRTRLQEVRDHTLRHLELTERLVEMVS
ncbi:MAG: hypothetical protein GX591_02045 [Planctomycetes bacterium]|nr:hypothetical protein [Planctomycetota bacterium]